MAIKQRGKKKTLSLYKRVPKRYEAVESRKFIWLSPVNFENSQCNVIQEGV